MFYLTNYCVNQPVSLSEEKFDRNCWKVAGWMDGDVKLWNWKTVTSSWQCYREEKIIIQLVDKRLQSFQCLNKTVLTPHNRKTRRLFMIYWIPRGIKSFILMTISLIFWYWSKYTLLLSALYVTNVDAYVLIYSHIWNTQLVHLSDLNSLGIRIFNSSRRGEMFSVCSWNGHQRGHIKIFLDPEMVGFDNSVKQCKKKFHLISTRI